MRRQFGEQSQERKEKKQGKPVVQKVEFNFSNLKNIVPDEEISPKLPPQSDNTKEQKIAKEDLLLFGPSIKVRFQKVVRKFNKE